jgi:drug/metabolite transporter (DMT)-like permease
MDLQREQRRMDDKRPMPVGANPTMGGAEWGLLVSLSVLWGGSFFFNGVAVRELPPLTIVLGRVGLAAPLLLALLPAGCWRRLRDPGLWAQFAVMAILNGLVPQGLIVWGQTHIDSGVASILNGTTPLFSVLLVPLLTADERLTPTRLAGVLLGLAGLALLVGVESVRGLGAQVLGQLAVVGAAVSYALAAIYGRRFRGLPVRLVAAGQVTAQTLLVLPLAALEQPWSRAPSLATWGALLGLALLSCVVGRIVYFRILSTAGATNLLLVTLLIPVSALALGMLVLGERPHWSAFAGMALIFAGIAAVDGRPLPLLRRRVQRAWLRRAATQG